jgi:NADH-ubiquinone oxidoreductase chain 4
MLSLLLIIPLIGCLLLSFIEVKNNELEETINSKMKKIALNTSLINLFISIICWIQFDGSISQYQFVEEYNKLSIFHLYLGVDNISIYFVLLTTLITPICILSNWTDITNKLKYFLISFLLLETLQIAVFVVLDLLLFYVFFESVLIPLFLIVGIWGASQARIRAAFLLFLYTLAGSLFMLLAIMVIYQNIGSTDFAMISLSEISLESQKILFLAFFLAFAVKTPLWPMHGWLFRAHAEAPLAGSILLAAVILKLATYGFLRVLLPFFPDATNFFMPAVQTICIITLVYSSLVTIRQTDLKALVAYSSVAHMAVVLLGIFSNTQQGIEGAIILSLAHGFVSPALFICVGGVLYSRYHTRIIKYYRGMVLTMPVFTILFLLFSLFNAAAPLSANFIGEFLALTGVFQRSPIVGILGASGIVLSACYSIWMFNRVSYGAWSPYLKPTTDLNRREYMLLLPLLICTVVFGIFPNIILDSLHLTVSNLLYTV